MKIKKFTEYVGPYSTTGYRYSKPTEIFTLTGFVVIPNKSVKDVIDTIESISEEYDVDVDIELKKINMSYLAKSLKSWFSKQEANQEINSDEQSTSKSEFSKELPVHQFVAGKKPLIEGFEEMFGRPTPDMIISSIVRELEGENIYEMKLVYKAYSQKEATSISNEIIEKSIEKIGEDEFMFMQYGIDLTSNLTSTATRKKIGF